MALISLSLRDFRCFATAELEFASKVNLITGENASGKTSLIESIFLLGRGRSFKTANLESTVRSGTEGFLITGQVTRSTASMHIGLVRTKGQLQAKIAGETPPTIAQLSEAFPVQLVDSQAHRLISGGPRWRRQFLDWGVFHVEPAFFPAWRRYQRALRHRNKLLRAGKPKKEVISWNNELVVQGEALDYFRREYLCNFISTAAAWADQVLGGHRVILEYRSGWPEQQSFRESLQTGIEQDYRLGMTRYGPHRADMVIEVAGRTAQEWVSSGQEKALAGALLLAQVAVYRALTGHPCTLLLDDLAAELDAVHLNRFLDRVDETGAQTLITVIDPSPIMMQRARKTFHVKQGEINPMV
jgi:DNA replication and repair protein RecF